MGVPPASSYALARSPVLLGGGAIVGRRRAIAATTCHAYGCSMPSCERVSGVPDATRELKAAIDLEPRHFRANLLLGRILALSGHADSAVPHLRTAVDVQPSSAEAHEFLADAYDRIGDRAAAALERQRAEQVRAKKPAA